MGVGGVGRGGGRTTGLIGLGSFQVSLEMNDERRHYLVKKGFLPLYN